MSFYLLTDPAGRKRAADDDHDDEHDEHKRHRAGKRGSRSDLFARLAGQAIAHPLEEPGEGGDGLGDNGDKIFGDDGALKKNIYGDVNGDEMTFGNKVMRTLGMASVVYTLGTAPAKIGFNDGVMGITDAAGNLGV